MRGDRVDGNKLHLRVLTGYVTEVGLTLELDVTKGGGSHGRLKDCRRISGGFTVEKVLPKKVLG